MTKRLLALFLVCILAIPILAVPASATTQDVVDAIEDLQAGLGTSQADIRDYLKSIDYWAQHIDSLITNNLISAINNARDQISNAVNSVHDAVDELQAGLGMSQRDILTALQTLDASVTGVVTNAINNCTSTLGSWLEYIHSYMVNNLGPAINNMSDRIATYLGYIDDHIINNVVVLFTQQWDGVDRKIRVITDRVYYVYKGFLTGHWISSCWRVPYGILFPDPKKSGEKLGEIVQGYSKPPFLNRVFATRIYRPKYYKYFDSWELEKLPALPAKYKPHQLDPMKRPVYGSWIRIRSRLFWRTRKIRKSEKHGKRKVMSTRNIWRVDSLQRPRKVGLYCAKLRKRQERIGNA